MIELLYTAEFIRIYKKLQPALKAAVKERLEEFRNLQNHQKLKVHKLHGELKDMYAFSVNYNYRVLFSWHIKGKAAYIQGMGDHSIYE